MKYIHPQANRYTSRLQACSNNKAPPDTTMKTIVKIFYTIILLPCSLGFYAMGISTEELIINVMGLGLQLLTLVVLMALWAPRPISTMALKTLGLTVGSLVCLMFLTSLFFLTIPEIRNSYSPFLVIQTSLAFTTIGLPALMYGLGRKH